jgi:hypothetical protein
VTEIPPPVPGPVPFTQLLDDALGWSRRHLKTIFLPSALPIAFTVGCVVLIQGLWFSQMGVSPGSAADPLKMMAGSLVLMLAVFVLLVVQMGGYVAMIVAASRAVAGQPVSMVEAWIFAFRLRTLGTVILTGLLLFAGYMCCCLPGIYIGLLLALIVPVMTLESIFGPDAMVRSRELASHNPSGRFAADPRVKIFVMTVVGYLISYGVGLVVQLALAGVQWAVMWRLMSRGENADPAAVGAQMAWIQAPANMIGTCVQLLMHLYISFGLALLYFDLKQRREGSDLEAALDAMSGPPAGPGEA